MDYALKERIGKPELFTGRKEELSFFIEWLDDIKDEKSQSTAILARRKMGKTALMERLFNITYSKNAGVIPFYYEIKEGDMWVGDFCIDFFMTFIYQYIAFKTRKPGYLIPDSMSSFKVLKQIVRKEGLDYLNVIIDSVEHPAQTGHIDLLWDTVRNAPKTMAFKQNEFIVQMIDEFQFLNAKIYRDRDMKIPAKTLAGGYLSTAESKIAPLLVSGSWVGWLMNELNTMLPARFKYEYLANMPEDEAVEMVYKYSGFFEVPVSEETAYLIAQISEGSPFYIASILRSRSRGKDLTTVAGLLETLKFETLDNRGTVKSTWMEYVLAAFKDVNQKNAKRLVLYLCKNRDREVTRKELLEKLDLDMDDGELETKLKALVMADIISQGQTNYDYRGVSDNIFDKVFRGVYEKEIQEFDVGTIGKEYGEALKKFQKKYNSLLGKYNYQKGLFVEYLLLEQLRVHGREKNALFKSVTRYLPEDFNFCEYDRVWRYDWSPEHGKGFNVDIYAHAVNPGDYSIIVEVKSRDLKKFSKNEVKVFERKFDEVKKIEGIDRAIGFIFSRSGFTVEAEDYCKERGIAISEDEKWFG